MAAVDLGVLELVYSFLSLLPGFVAFKTFLHFSREARTYDRFETATWSLLGSGVSLFVLYASVLVVRSVAAGRPVLSVDTLPPLEVLVLGYPVLLLTSFAIGVASGRTLDRIRRTRGERRLRKGPWEYWKRMLAERPETVRQLLGEGPAEVTVSTRDGTEIAGELFVAGSVDMERDVLLAWPERVVRDDEGAIVDRVALGKFAYVHEDSVGTITFERGRSD